MTIVDMKNVSVNYDNSCVLNNVNLALIRGDFMTITGPNGSGKTTLLRTMLGLIRPDKGKVLFFNTDGERVKKLHVGYLPQKNNIDVRFPITVGETVESGLLKGAFGRITDNDRRRFDEVCREMGIDGYLDRRIGELSGGQLQRTLLGRAVISEPELLVLDEPLSYVDKQFESQIYSIIKRLSERMTIVLVSHELSKISELATRHLVVDRDVHECHSPHHSVHLDCDC